MTERWDERVKDTATKIEGIVNTITSKGLLQREGGDAAGMVIE